MAKTVGCIFARGPYYSGSKPGTKWPIAMSALSTQEEDLEIVMLEIP